MKMEKHEPLKNKIVLRVREQDGFEWEDYERNIDNIDMNRQALVCELFYLHDVKSAVQGLLEEIDKEIEEAELEKEGKGYYRFFDNVMTLKRAKSLIKKWFPDILEEG